MTTAGPREQVRQPTTARTSIYTFACVMAGSATALATTLYVGNAAGLAGTGAFFQIMAFFSIAGIACVFGADTALVRFVSAEVALGRPERFFPILRHALVPPLAAGVGMALLLLALAPLAGAWGLGDANVVPAIRVAAPFVAVAVLLNVLFGALRGLGSVVEFALLQNIVLPLVRLGAVVLVVVGGATVVSLSAAWSVPVAIVAVAAILAVRRGSRHAMGSGRARVPAEPATSAQGFWSFASARGLSALVEVVLEWIDVIAVAVFLGPVEAGIYGVVNRCVRMGVMLEHTARIVTSPLISAALAVGDRDGARRIFSSTGRFLILGAWPFYLTLALFGPAVLGFFGPGFTAGSNALAVIAITMMVAVSTGGVQSMLLMGGRSRWQLINKTAALAAAAAMNVLLVPLWGIMGAVTAWAVAVAVDDGLAALEVAFSMRIRTGWDTVFPPAVVAFAVFGVGGLLVRLAMGPTTVALICMVAVGGSLYAVLIVLLRRWLGVEELLVRLSGRRGRRA